MLVQFCDYDGTVIFEEEREDISDLIAIFKNGGKLNYYEDQDFYFHGKLDDLIFFIQPDPENEDEMIDILKLYFLKDEAKSSE